MAGRAGFNTRLGFILAAIGSAVGIGNLYRFPYLTATNGGGTFVAIYLVFLFLIGLPALLAELAIGRSAGKGAAQAFPLRNGGNANWIGYLGITSAIVLLSYYSVIAGWGLRYLYDVTTAPYFEDAAAYFDRISLGDGAILFHFLFMLFTALILIRGVGKGIERANFIFMPALFLVVVGLVIYGNLQDGAAAGRSFYLEPDFSEVTASTITAAAGQTFFSIGLGLGTMLTYGSYLKKDTNIQSTSMIIGFADTGVAILAGFMVFPLLFSLGLQDLVNPANSGSVGGLFIVLPTAFGEIGGAFAVVLAVGFFIMLTFAAISSAVSLLEVPVASFVDRTGASRTKVVVLMALLVYALGVPSAITFNVFNLFDLLINNILLLGGGLFVALYAGWFRPDVLDELGVGGNRRLVPAIRFIVRYPLTVGLLFLFGLGIYSFVTDVNLG